MPRSTYVYVVMEGRGQARDLPVAAFTVKHEMINWLARQFDGADPTFATLDVYRCRDGWTWDTPPARMGTALDVLNAHQEVSAALTKLDGTTASAVALLTGMTVEQLDDFGGVS